ncbi:MAG: aminoacyl-histidine dipeptidase [Spirochaetales bacterium]|nr:aminoacyl-histidine dipeptidase [Candidatus Physcosoma equi]
MWYEQLNNTRLWKIFNDISAIPRESHNEEGIRQYLLAWAKEHNIEVIVDRIGNVIMKCPATKGYENYPSIALQGHMDMVCVKTEDSKHDFTKDPIEVVTDGTFVRAKDTSLGADNGIAIALALDIFSDEKAEHGPLEGIFTVAEETGLTGAFGIDPENIQSRRLLNLDSEEEGIFYIGCAGGIDIVSKKHAYWKDAEGEAVLVKVNGLLGGHSGGEIHKERANALKTMGRFLNRLPAYEIASISGGSRRNVIPSVCEALITVRDAEIAETTAKNLLEELKEEYKYSDPDINITVVRKPLPAKTLTPNVSESIGNTLFTSPTGVRSWSMALKGVVETSDNMAIISLDEKEASIIYSIRSSVESAKLNLAYEIAAILEGNGFLVKIGDGYPAWSPDPDSAFTKEVAEAYEKIVGKAPVITAIHAGLECGIINKAIPGMDSLSLGPNLFDVHSVNEHVEAASAERTASFVKEMLKDIK